MSVNRYKPHVYLVPEDDANRQLALGFLDHWAVDERVVDPRAPAGGWGAVLDVFEREYVKLLRGNGNAHVIMIIDFDMNVEERRAFFRSRIPGDMQPRVFVIGCQATPERLRAEFGMHWEKIGCELADDCRRNDFARWSHPHLVHNQDELKRMGDVLRILFQVN